MKQNRAHLPCPHERIHKQHRKRTENHYPLTRREVELLFRRARQTGSDTLRQSIGLRLCQGITGYTCPTRYLSAEVRQRAEAITNMYQDFGFRQPTRALVRAIHKTMGAAQ